MAGCILLLLTASDTQAQSTAALASEVEKVYAGSAALYQDLHRNPELSLKETQTASKIAGLLRELGYEVTTGVGGTGVVGVLKNGNGPTVMLRTELDALPVTENTGLAFASTVKAKDASGVEVGVMHACGHDLHMASTIGAARIMAGSRNTWKGTLVVIGQPAEEIGAGAKAMIADGLLKRFPRPDFAIAMHDDPRFPSGQVGFRAGPVLSNSDQFIIKIFGRGGHGARPEITIDPVVIAARTVLALQTIVSREVSPFTPAVITVGTIHGGTKNNIIPDEVVLQLSVRSFTPQVREQLLKAIDRVVKAEAAAAGAPRAPSIERIVVAEALVNDSALTRRISGMLVRTLGASRAFEIQPEMVSEDFSEFHIAGVPALQLRIGTVEPAKFAAAQKSGEQIPALHSSQFWPDLEPAMKTAIMAEVLSLRELMPVGKR